MSDLDFRKKTIPYLGQIYGYNRNEKSDTDISRSLAAGDLINLAKVWGPLPLKDNYIRILRPARSELVGVYLSLALRMATTEPLSQMLVSVTKTVAENNLAVVALTDAEIIAKHRTLRGSDAPFSNTPGQLIVINKLDLTPLIPKFGDPDFRTDCFVIGLHFPAVPHATIDTGFKLTKFEVNGSALIVSK
jgi:hypothetical protein